MTAVAVCIPAYDETAAIANVVTSVRSCGYPQELLRVIVAVDGGNPDVVTAASAAGAQVCVVEPNQGSYAARNAAAARARNAAVLLFTDADCTVMPGWIAAHLRTLERYPLSGGSVEFVFSADPPRPAEWVDAFRHLKQELYVTKEHYAATANLAVRRAVFDEMKFDATLRTGGDADFGRRAHAAGYEIAYTPEARVQHPARPTKRDLLKKVRRLASGAARARRLRGVTSARLPRLTRSAYRSAREAGLAVGPVWGARACALEFRAQWILYRAVRRSSSAKETVRG